MKLKAVIVDVDGTLVETENYHRIAFNKTFLLNNLNFSWDKLEYKKLLEIAGGKERLIYFFKQKKLDHKFQKKNFISDLYDQKRNIYKSILPKSIKLLRPGVNHLLKRLKSNNIKISIATSSSFISVNSLSKSIWNKPIKDVFDEVITGDDVFKKKPSPEVFNLSLDKLNIQNSDCVVIEDSKIGLKAAKLAKIKTLITPSFFTMDQNFEDADYITPNLEYDNLPKFLKKFY